MKAQMLSTQKELSGEQDHIERALEELCNFHDDHLLTDALRHHLLSGGKRTRAGFTYQFSSSLQIAEQDSILLACIPELLHNASLIHDDLQDQDEERRNNPSVWKKFGPDIAICAGDFLISAAYSCAAKLNTEQTTEIIQAIHDYVSKVIKGQIDDLAQDKDQSLDNIALYQRISAQKSGPLLAMTLSLPLIYAQRQSFKNASDEAFYHYATAYQISDDLQDIEQDQSKEGQKSGLNIVTILQNAEVVEPVRAAYDLALDHIAQALSHVALLPFPANTLLEKELGEMEKRFNTFKSKI